MKKLSVIFVVSILSGIVFAAESLMKAEWKIDSYMMEDVGAWSDDEAKHLIQKTVVFEKNGFKLGGSFCKAKILMQSKAEAKELTSDMKGPFCGQGKFESEVYSIELDCNDKVSFVPYIAKLSNSKYLAFGDGIRFCLSK